MLISADDLTVRGNQVVSSDSQDIFNGIAVQGVGSVLIEGNQAVGWTHSGIMVSGSGKIVQKNQVSQNDVGIRGDGDNTITNNIATGNFVGVQLSGATTATRNAVSGNAIGIEVRPGFTGTVEENDVFGNSVCGVTNHLPTLLAPHNYWGAATGPGPDPADRICDAVPGNVTLPTPVATRPYIIKAPINP